MLNNLNTQKLIKNIYKKYITRESDIIKMLYQEFDELMHYAIKTNKRRKTHRLIKEIEQDVLNNVEAWLKEDRIILTPELLSAYRQPRLYFKSILLRYELLNVKTDNNIE